MVRIIGNKEKHMFTILNNAENGAGGCERARGSNGKRERSTQGTKKGSRKTTGYLSEGHCRNTYGKRD